MLSIETRLRSTRVKGKRNKDVRINETVIEILKIFDDLRIDEVTKMINEIYDTGELPEDANRSSH